MRRTLLLVLALLLVAHTAHAQEPTRLAATLAACETGASASERFAVFTGSMPARGGTSRMAIRFDLEERRGDTTGFRPVVAPKFGRWDRSKAGAAGFVYTKRVMKLAQGRWYRAVVRFKWIDANGRTQRTARRVTTACHQPDPRANLELAALGSSRPGSYLVTIVNTGMAAAPESTVSLEPRPETDSRRRVPPLAPGERTTVVVEADPCAPQSVVVVQLDRLKVVDESREDDNRVESACPDADRLE
jgi:hypothetical protein